MSAEEKEVLPGKQTGGRGGEREEERYRKEGRKERGERGGSERNKRRGIESYRRWEKESYRRIEQEERHEVLVVTVVIEAFRAPILLSI